MSSQNDPSEEGGGAGGGGAGGGGQSGDDQSGGDGGQSGGGQSGGGGHDPESGTEERTSAGINPVQHSE